MISALLSWSARHGRLILATAVLLLAGGEVARRVLARDVVPDLADPQLGIVVDWMGHPAGEVAALITTPLVRALTGLPGSKAVRGSTMSGMSYVDVIFPSEAALETARAAVLERIAAVRPGFPSGARVQVGPNASSTGWVYEYALIDPGRTASLLELRRIQDEVLRPALAAIPGVAEVASVGGGLQQVRIEVKPRELRQAGVAFSDVVAALRPAFAAGVARTSLAQLEARPVPVPGRLAEPVRLGDVARVRITDDMQTGLADVGGYPAVGGIVIARRGADLAALVGAVRRTLDRESAHFPRRAADPGRMDSGAPARVEVITAYDRLELATRVRHTLLRALAEEVAVVVVVILLFLVDLRSGLVPLITLPAVLLLTFGAMWLLGVPATIMSLGGIGIALGMAVDADIVALEAAHRRLETLPRSAAPERRRAELLRAVRAVAPAILISLLVTALSFLPVFAFTGETGRLLRPLALTKTLVVISAALVSLTLAPALRDRLLGGRVVPEFDNPLTRGLVRAYRPFVHLALTRPAITLATAVLALASCLPILGRLGGEFLPRIEEGDLLYMPTTLPGAPPDQVATQLAWQDHALSQFGEVATAFGKVGHADTGTDPAPYSMAETTIRLRPRPQWPAVERARWYSGWAPAPLRRILGLAWPERGPRTTAELVEALDRAVRLPGWRSAWTAPARARMDMMATGVRTPVGIRIVSPDPARLDALGAALQPAVAGVAGTRSAVFESLGGEPWLTFEPDPAAMARFSVDPALVRSTGALIATGGQMGELELDGKRLRVRLAPESPDVEPRGAADELREITVRAQGRPVPLGLLGRPWYAQLPAALRVERGELVAYLYVDLADGVDLDGYLQRARAAVHEAIDAGEVRLAPGERIEWTGQSDLLAAGRARLRWIVPVVVLSMLALLILQFRSLPEALIVLASVPFALVGSFWTLHLLHYPLSAPVWVGLLSTVGLAMQTGVVMVVYIDEAFHRRMREGRIRTRQDIVAAHAEGTVLRLRPKLMTITTMAASLLPLLWSEGPGAEVMRRVAAPMLGGLVTSAFLTLEVLPVLYTIWRARQLLRARAAPAHPPMAFPEARPRPAAREMGAPPPA